VNNPLEVADTFPGKSPVSAKLLVTSCCVARCVGTPSGEGAILPSNFEDPTQRDATRFFRSKGVGSPAILRIPAQRDATIFSKRRVEFSRSARAWPQTPNSELTTSLGSLPESPQPRVKPERFRSPDYQLESSSGESFLTDSPGSHEKTPCSIRPKSFST
jgi:hypothetical protein